MIKHIVLLKIKEGVKERSVTECLEAISGLKDKIEGIISIDYGGNNSPEHKNNGYQYGFTVCFTDALSRDRYVPHSAHQEVIKRHIAPIVSDVIVFDYEVNEGM